MHVYRSVVCSLLLGASSVSLLAQEAQNPFIDDDPSPVSVIKTPSETSLDYQFKIDPVELQISEELDSAKEYYGEGSWQQAIQLLTRFLNENPNHDREKDALFLRGESFVQQQQYKQARRDFERLLVLKPNPTQTAHSRFRIAEAALLLGERVEAQQLLQQFRNSYPRHELNAYVLPYLAETVARKGNFDWARGLYAEALQKFPNGPLRKECQLRSAILAYQQKNYNKAAENLFTLVETKDADSVEFWTASYWLAMTEMHTNREQQAVERFIGLAEAQPNHQLAVASTFRAAEAYRLLKQPQKAIEFYRTVQEKSPDSKYASQALVGEMQLAKELGQFDRAYELAERLQQLGRDTDGTTPGSKADIAAREKSTRMMAEILLAQEKYNEAAALMRPLGEKSVSLPNQAAREAHYKNLFLLALAERGVSKYNRANQLLSRIRVDLVDRDLAERVLLARTETLNAAKEYNAATEAGFRYEGRFRNGKYIGAIRAQMVIGMLGANRRDEAMIKFKQQLGNEQSPRANAADIARAARYLGESLYEAKDYDNARIVFTTLESVHENEDDLAQAVSALAWIEQKSGNKQGAAVKFDEFIARFPNHPSAIQVRLANAQTMFEAGEKEKAIEALEYFETLPANDPMRIRGVYQLAELLHHNPKSRPRAEQIVERLLKENPKFEQRDAALYLQGIIRRSQDNPSAAASFQELIEEHKTSKYWSDALYRMAEQARDKRETGEAKEYLTRLISAERDPQVLPHAIYMKGRIESSSRNWEQSRETLRTLIRNYPQSELVPVARYGVAESFYQEKNFSRALQLFDILDREKDFQSDEAWGAMVQLRRAQLLAERQDNIGAIRIAEKIAERFPNFSLQNEVDYLLGRAHAARGDFSDARDYYAKIAAADENRTTEVSAMAQWMTGESYFHQKKYIVAIKAYEALVADTQYPKWQAASNLQIGKCYELLKNPEQAQKYYSRVINRFGDSELAKEAQHRLKIVERKLQ